MKKPNNTILKNNNQTNDVNQSSYTTKNTAMNSKTTKNDNINTKNTKKEKIIKEEEEELPLTLIIDNEDKYLEENKTVVYFNFKRIIQTNNLKDKIFDNALIVNTPTEDVSSLALTYILRKLKINSKITIVVDSPLTVMQGFYALQIEANAKLAGFDNLEIIDYEVEDKNSKSIFKTKAVIGVRPEKNPNVVEIKIQTKSKL